MVKRLLSGYRDDSIFVDAPQAYDIASARRQGWPPGTWTGRSRLARGGGLPVTYGWPDPVDRVWIVEGPQGTGRAVHRDLIDKAA
jgi:hypothetical protein